MKLVKKSEQIELSKIKKSPYFFRDTPAEEDVEALADSIKTRGQIHPIGLVKLHKMTAKGHLYEIINGHRRFLACQSASLPTVRADIYEYTPEELADESERQTAIVQFLYDANLQEPLTPVERAEQFVAMMESFDLTPTELADMFHKPVGEIEEDLKYAFIDTNVREEISKPENARKISHDHLRILASYAAPTKRGWRLSSDQQLEVVNKLISEEDKRLLDRPQLLEKEIKELKKQARDEVKARKEKSKGPEDITRQIFKQVDRVEKAATDLLQLDVPAGFQISFVDRKALISRIANVAGALLDFTDAKFPSSTQLRLSEEREMVAADVGGGSDNA